MRPDFGTFYVNTLISPIGPVPYKGPYGHFPSGDYHLSSGSVCGSQNNVLCFSFETCLQKNKANRAAQPWALGMVALGRSIFFLQVWWDQGERKPALLGDRVLWPDPAGASGRGTEGKLLASLSLSFLISEVGCRQWS